MGDGSQGAASAYSNSVTPSDRPQGPAQTQSYSNAGGYAMTAVGGLTSAYASYASGQANARIARINAKLAQRQADQAIQTGHLAVGRVQSQERQIEASQQASAAGQGIVAGAGTQRNLAESSQAAADMDERMIGLNAAREAYGYKSRAAIDTFQGRLAEQEGTAAAAETALNTGNRLWQEYDASRRITWG
jgi:hypothetical protein